MILRAAHLALPCILEAQARKQTRKQAQKDVALDEALRPLDRLAQLAGRLLRGRDDRVALPRRACVSHVFEAAIDQPLGRVGARGERLALVQLSFELARDLPRLALWPEPRGTAARQIGSSPRRRLRSRQLTPVAVTLLAIDAMIIAADAARSRRGARPTHPDRGRVGPSPLMGRALD